MAASVSGSEPASEGPVLNLINKKLRALKKKYNRIIQTEENQNQGKPLNKEQEDVLKSKPVVCALIDEYEKLRSPLSAAVQEELSRVSPPQISKSEEGEEGRGDFEPVEPEEEEKKKLEVSELDLEDLLGLIYFASLFDIKIQNQAYYVTMLVTKMHERECCLTYDCVTDEPLAEMLGERDIDMISNFGGLLTSRPANAEISHKDALESCIQHAKRWLSKSEEPIESGSSVTYVRLRERLKRIMALDYFTMVPRKMLPHDEILRAELHEVSLKNDAAGGFMIPGFPQRVFQQPQNNDEPRNGDESAQDESSAEFPTGTGDQDEERNEAESEQYEDQQRGSSEKGPQQYNPRRTYQNQRGGRGGPRRGYSNGRGGRGARGGGDGRGGYANGRGQQYYDSGYYPRNYYGGRGRGGGGGGGRFGGHGPTAASAHGGQVAVEANP